MSGLKRENVNKCFSLLREYIAEAPRSSKKDVVILALDQLQRVTAGNISPACHARPLADGS